MLTDCVPSKALIATIADYMSDFEVASRLGVRLQDDDGDEVTDAVALAHTVNDRILDLAAAQSADIQRSLEQVGVSVLHGTARSASRGARGRRGRRHPSGAARRRARRHRCGSPVMDTMRPDGERILTWQQVYTLHDLPERVIVIGSGVTGAELAQAYLGLGSRSCSSRRATACCLARTPTPPPSSKTSSASGDGGAREVAGRELVERTADGVVVTLVDTTAPSRGRTRCSPSGRCPTRTASVSRRSASS